jgi:hypothetical protein
MLIKLKYGTGILLMGCCCLLAPKSPAQTSAYTIPTEFASSIAQMDSIKATNDIGRHFSSVFSSAMKNIATELSRKDSVQISFYSRFVINFCYSFLKEYRNEKAGTLAPSSPWKAYYSHPDAESWQLVAAGVNAHINSDMWNDLAGCTDYREFVLQKKNFLSAQGPLTKVYLDFFEQLDSENRLFHFLNHFTKGLPKLIGKYLVNKWRHRQVRLAFFYFTDEKKFQRLMALVKRKKDHNDKLIFETFAPKKKSPAGLSTVFLHAK